MVVFVLYSFIFKNAELTRGLSVTGLVWNTAGRNEIVDVISFTILALVFTTGCLLNSLLPSVDLIFSYISVTGGHAF